jgi:hypothetical protein
MNTITDWDDFAADERQPVPIGDILPEVLASYGLAGISMGSETPILCGESAGVPFAMAEAR